MTSEEALEELDSLIIPRDGEQDKLADAFEMEIKALEQEPCDVHDINDGNISETQESENTCDGCYNFESEHMSRVIKNLYDSLESEEISREEIATLLARGSEELCGDPCKELPSAQPEPSEITDEQAILHLQSTGWMQNHDREMYESGLREKLADDSGSYDSLTLCEDAISRREAIKKFQYNYKGERIPDYDCDNFPVQIAMKTVKEILRELPSVTPKQRWIPVGEGLPKEGKTVIASVKDGVYPEAKYTKEYGWEWAYEAGADYWVELEDVTAWMPLPQPYESHESEDKE